VVYPFLIEKVGDEFDRTGFKIALDVKYFGLNPIPVHVYCGVFTDILKSRDLNVAIQPLLEVDTAHIFHTFWRRLYLFYELINPFNFCNR